MIKSPQNTCMSCFIQHAAPINPCTVCGYDEQAQEIPPHILRPRTILNGKYLLGKVLGQGGFGITYIGWDLNLDIKVAVKEYYPTGFVSRETTSVGIATVQPFTGSQGEYFIQGREKFINEARTLAKFFALPGIVSIKDFFQENSTAYISMEFIDGQTLKDYLADMGGRLPAGRVFDLMKPVMYSLAEVHNAGLIHRDISPDNIMISSDSQMKLLDFGAARDFSDSGNKSLSIMLKPGFAPEEQYRSRGVQGPWTDVYALSATIYKCITGITPEESVERVRMDEVRPPSIMGILIDPAREAALMRGMAVLQEYRFKNVSEMYFALYVAQTGVPAAAIISATMPSAAASAENTPQAQNQAAPQVFTPTPISMPTLAAAKPKRMTKQKWIMAIACGVMVGVLVFAWNMWQQNATGPETSEGFASSLPPIESPTIPQTPSSPAPDTPASDTPSPSPSPTPSPSPSPSPVPDNGGGTEYYPGDWLRTFTDVTGLPLRETRVTDYGADRVEADILEYKYSFSADALASYKEYLLSIGFTLHNQRTSSTGFFTIYEYVRDSILVEITHGDSLLWLIVRFR